MTAANRKCRIAGVLVLAGLLSGWAANLAAANPLSLSLSLSGGLSPRLSWAYSQYAGHR